MTKKDRKLFVRFHSYEEIQFEDGSFLANNVDGSIHFIDQFSAALWRFVEAPRTFDECVAVFISALPEAPAEKIEERVRLSLKKMRKENWIVTVPHQ